MLDLIINSCAMCKGNAIIYNKTFTNWECSEQHIVFRKYKNSLIFDFSILFDENFYARPLNSNIFVFDNGFGRPSLEKSQLTVDISKSSIPITNTYQLTEYLNSKFQDLKAFL